MANAGAGINASPDKLDKCAQLIEISLCNAANDDTEYLRTDNIVERLHVAVAGLISRKVAHSTILESLRDGIAQVMGREVSGRIARVMEPSPDMDESMAKQIVTSVLAATHAASLFLKIGINMSPANRLAFVCPCQLFSGT